jgi:hypothetical protein
MGQGNLIFTLYDMVMLVEQQGIMALHFSIQDHIDKAGNGTTVGWEWK